MVLTFKISLKHLINRLIHLKHMLANRINSNKCIAQELQYHWLINCLIVKKNILHFDSSQNCGIRHSKYYHSVSLLSLYNLCSGHTHQMLGYLPLPSPPPPCAEVPILPPPHPFHPSTLLPPPPNLPLPHPSPMNFKCLGKLRLWSIKLPNNTSRPRVRVGSPHQGKKLLGGGRGMGLWS